MQPIGRRPGVQDIQIALGFPGCVFSGDFFLSLTKAPFWRRFFKIFSGLLKPILVFSLGPGNP